jgi:hypothetical protein
VKKVLWVVQTLTFIGVVLFGSLIIAVATAGTLGEAVLIWFCCQVVIALYITAWEVMLGHPIWFLFGSDP